MGTSKFYEDVAGNVLALVYDDGGQLVNVLRGFDKQQPLPGPAIVAAARSGWPFAPCYNADDFDGKSMAQVETELKQLGRNIATIDKDSVACFPYLATPSGKQFVIRWFF